MSNEQVAGMKAYLTNSHLQATPDWVEGCVEFFISEHNGRGFTTADLKDFVFSQWKLADLREMGQGCLPGNLKDIMKTTLPGIYALQVESMLDIGQSAYSQLQQIRKQVDKENVEVGATLPQTWEPRPTRVLKLKLSDGVQYVDGMEYRPIKSLNEILLPGCKVLVTGPVECRRGVLLLQEQNLKLIGGEIGNILVPNAIENVLARRLNVVLNPDPYRTQTNVNVEPETVIQQALSLGRNDSVQLSAQQNSASGSRINGSTAPAIQNRNGSSQMSDRILEEEFLCEEDNMLLGAAMDAELMALEHENQDEFRNNQDIDELEQQYLGELQAMGLDEMEYEAMHQQESPGLQQEKPPENKPENSDVSYLLDDDDDDRLLQISVESLERPVNSNISQNMSTFSRLDSRQTGSLVQTTSVPAGKRNGGITLSRKLSAKCKTQSSNSQSKITSFLNKSTADISDSGPSSSNTVHSSNISSDGEGVVKMKTLQMSNFRQRNRDQCEVFTNATNVSSKAVSSNDTCGQIQIVQVNNLKECKVPKKNIDLDKDIASFDGSKHHHIQDSSSSVSECDRVSQPHIPKRNFEFNYTDNSDHNSKQDKQMTRVTNSIPFVYLIQIKSKTFECRRVFTVKAFVMTLLSTLAHGRDGWKLRVELCDGSSNLDVQLSSEVLEKLIGFKTEEMRDLVKQIPSNPSIKEQLKNIQREAQQKLIGLNCLMDIEFLPDSETPCVIKLTDVNEQHFKALHARVNSVS
ncbi:recQ-mediated genome instability protein 1-like [Periplaneta americana]|uniref:recQ-mediated genome instability protein 1-like n=1 Tax=Periplaneta americana TaxID=6978 RepID=UPI0037E9B839